MRLFVSMRYSPKGFMFANKGSVCFPNSGNSWELPLALMNSKVVKYLLLILSPTLDFSEGPVGKIPVMLKSDIYPNWKDNLFVGSLSFQYLERIELVGTRVIKREKILNKIGRVRNVIEGPDGYLYVSVERKGIFKIIPDTIEISKTYE